MKRLLSTLRIYIHKLEKKTPRLKFPLLKLQRALKKINRLELFPRLKEQDYKDWVKSEQQQFKKLKKTYAKEVVKKMSRLNKKHKGSVVCENAPGYVIECRNLEKWYVNSKTNEYSRVLKNLNLKIKFGELVVILGESGSGKTTLLNILSGMERATNGESIVFSHSLISMSQDELTLFRAKYLSIIFQNYALIPELTVRENILVGQRIQSNVRKRMDVDQIAELLKITAQLPKVPKALSGGQQQRVSIARALAKNPQLIFADEPTGAVDADTCRDILNIFVEINRKFGTTILLITHNRLIAKIAHKVIRIDKGMIISTISQMPLHPNQIDWH